MSENASEGGQSPDQAGTSKEVVNTGTWRDALTNDLKNHELIKDFQKPSEAIQDYIKVKGELAQSVKIPDEQATDEEKASFYEKLGYPKDGKYGFQRPEDMPENLFDKDAVSEFEKVSSGLRLTKAQAEGLYKWYNTYTNQKFQGMTNAQSKANEAAIAALKQEWQGDSFDKNVSIASRAFREVCGSEVGKSFEEFVNTREVDGVKLGNHPLFLKYFHELGKSVLEDSASIKKANPDALAERDEDAVALKMFPSMAGRK